jgi:peroxiredoxin
MWKTPPNHGGGQQASCRALTVRKILTVLAAAAVVVAVFLAGSWLGSIYGEHRAQNAQQKQRVELDAFLKSHITGIEVGRPFPSVTLWTPDGSQGFEIPELLPEGGVVYLVSAGCKSCIDGLKAMQTARQALGDSALQAVAVVDSDAESVATLMAENGIALPLYWDLEMQFYERYNVRTARTYFVLDADNRLTRMGSAGIAVDEYLAILGGHTGVAPGGRGDRGRLSER